MPPSNRLLRPAQFLDELYLTLNPEPLLTPEELQAFYRGKVNEVRGPARIGRLKLHLQRAHGAVFFKSFVIGHRGVGKSTELAKLEGELRQYRVLRLSVANELDPLNFRVFDVLVLLMSKLIEETRKVISDSKLNERLPKSFFEDLVVYLGQESVKTTETDSESMGVQAGAEIKTPPILLSILKVFAKATSEMKYAADRKTERVEYRLNRLATLVDLLNRILSACYGLLREATGQDWLILGEDFDKDAVPESRVRDCFINYGPVFRELQAHLVFSVPIELMHAEDGGRRAFQECCTVYDTPVYEADFDPHTEGRGAVREILLARVDEKLFEHDQMERLIVASGGNLRDLFSLVAFAGDTALLDSPARSSIGAGDVTAAVNNLRTEYTRKLGDSRFHMENIPYEEKVKRLLAVYRKESGAEVPSRALYWLLRARAVQEFNGVGRFGVHPLVVDVLKEQQHLPPQAPGGTI